MTNGTISGVIRFPEWEEIWIKNNFWKFFLKNLIKFINSETQNLTKPKQKKHTEKNTVAYSNQASENLV